MPEPTQEKSALENIQEAMQRIKENGKELADFFHVYCFIWKAATDEELVRNAQLFLGCLQLKRLTKVIASDGNEDLRIKSDLYQSLNNYLTSAHKTYVDLLHLKIVEQITREQEEQLKAAHRAMRFLTVAIKLLEIEMGIKNEEDEKPNDKSKATENKTTWWQFWR